MCEKLYRLTPHVAMLIVLTVPHVVSGATFSVNSTADRHDASLADGVCHTGALTPQGKPECTLRAAIEQSNAHHGFPATEIDLPPGTYALTLGGLEISQDMNLIGTNAGTTILDGTDIGVFEPVVFTSETTNPLLTMFNITIRKGGEGGIRVGVGSYLYLADSIVSDNTRGQGGVGIWNRGNLTLIRSTVRNNRVTGTGGGVTGAGGGIWNQGNATIIESTISNNQAIRGGGIANNELGSRRMDITNSTISGNKASRGGGIYNTDVMDIAFSTITDNEAGLVSGEPQQNWDGGGISNVGRGQLNIGNTIIAGNRQVIPPGGGLGFPPLPASSPDCFSQGTFTFLSYRDNLVGILNQDCKLQDSTWGDTRFDFVGSAQNPLDPKLSRLSNNGGPTQTHALLSGSPAIDNGRGVSSFRFMDCPATDQRGFLRPSWATPDHSGPVPLCDIGAFEVVQENAFITRYALNSPPLRSNFPNFVGMSFTVGSKPLGVSSLGRACVSGNSETHIIKLVSASAGGSDVPGGAVSVDMARCTPGQFVYSRLDSPIVLPAGGIYYLVSQEANGGDQWYNHGAVSSTADAAVNSSIYFDGSNWLPYDGPNTSYVPPNFVYSVLPPDSNQGFVISYNLNNQRLRNDFDGWVGAKFTVGTSAITPVGWLGRICVAGNKDAHVVKIVRASDGVTVPGASVLLEMYGCTPGQFSYATLPTPVTLLPNTAYFLVSQEQRGGDQWYQHSTVTTTNIATVNSSVYSADGINWTLIDGANTSYGPPNFR